jgi:hypothetical protein
VTVTRTARSGSLSRIARRLSGFEKGKRAVNAPVHSAPIPRNTSTISFG